MAKKSFLEHGFTRQEKSRIRRTLLDAGMKSGAWPRIFPHIESATLDWHEGANAPGAVVHAPKEKKKFKALGKKLDAVAQKYDDQLGELSQWHLDDQCQLRQIVSGKEVEEWAALVSAHTGQHICPTPSTVRLTFRQLMEILSSAVRLAQEKPNLRAHVQETGRRRNHAMHQAVSALLDIFEEATEATGEPPSVYTSSDPHAPGSVADAPGYAGNFYPFAVACLLPLGLVEDTYLGSSVVAAYNEWCRVEPEISPAVQSKK